MAAHINLTSYYVRKERTFCVWPSEKGENEIPSRRTRPPPLLVIKFVFSINLASVQGERMYYTPGAIKCHILRFPHTPQVTLAECFFGNDGKFDVHGFGRWSLFMGDIWRGCVFILHSWPAPMASSDHWAGKRLCYPLENFRILGESRDIMIKTCYAILGVSGLCNSNLRASKSAISSLESISCITNDQLGKGIQKYGLCISPA